jgi:hypothetical protein
MDRRIADGLDKEINILGAEALKAVNAAQARAYDEAVDLASGAILVLSLNPNLKPFFLAQARRAIELRGGGVGSGRHYVRAIAADVLTDITERGTRRLATHLSTRLQGKIRDDVVEGVEAASAADCGRRSIG